VEYRRLYILVEGNDDERFILYRDKGTDTLTKEKFDRLISAKYVSRIDFMQEILENFRMETAKQNNKSFRYFIRKRITSAT
jgi:hypothetical protein